MCPYHNNVVKPLYLKEAMDSGLLDKYKDKILSLTLTEEMLEQGRIFAQHNMVLADQKVSWGIEHAQRNFLADGMHQLFRKGSITHEDLCCMSDLDEIPDKDQLGSLRENFTGITIFQQRNHYYTFRWYNLNYWYGTLVMKYVDVLQHSLQDYRNWRLGFSKALCTGGHHCSYFGDYSKILTKIESIVEGTPFYNQCQKVSNDKLLDIKYKVDSGMDMYNRESEKLHLWTDWEALPTYLDVDPEITEIIKNGRHLPIKVFDAVAHLGNVFSEIRNSLFSALAEKFPDRKVCLVYGMDADDAIYVILGFRHLVTTHAIKDLPRHFIPYQLEQLRYTGQTSKDYLEYLRHSKIVWDYSRDNVEYLLNHNINARWVPIGYDKNLEFSITSSKNRTMSTITSGVISDATSGATSDAISDAISVAISSTTDIMNSIISVNNENNENNENDDNNDNNENNEDNENDENNDNNDNDNDNENDANENNEKTIDVLFYGASNHRRLSILTRLRDAGIYVVYYLNCWGDFRSDLIRKSKIVLNIHHFDEGLLELARLSVLLANKVFIISEACDRDPKLNESLSKSMHLIKRIGPDYDCSELIRSVRHFLANPEERLQIANTGYETFRTEFNFKNTISASDLKWIYPNNLLSEKDSDRQIDYGDSLKDAQLDLVKTENQHGPKNIAIFVCQSLAETGTIKTSDIVTTICNFKRYLDMQQWHMVLAYGGSPETLHTLDTLNSLDALNTVNTLKDVVVVHTKMPNDKIPNDTMPTDTNELTIQYRDWLLKQPEFWSKIKSITTTKNCTDKVLIFGPNTKLLRRGVEHFLKYDYIGAPYNEESYIGGDGSLSIRSLQKSIECANTISQSVNGSNNDKGTEKETERETEKEQEKEKRQWESTKEEDIYSRYVVKTGGLVAPRHIAKQFAVKEVFFQKPMGIVSIQI